ncbi:hypothetical protein K562_30555 [Burkholderia cenocepacia]|nr:hypothetical protein K562_30555 [Burkholderia cenocepacia]
MSDERMVRAGDHLWVQRPGYEHHGLASGSNTVIQYSGKDGDLPPSIGPMGF